MKTIFLTVTADGAPILFCSACQKTRHLIFGTDKNVRGDTLLSMLSNFAHIHNQCHARNAGNVVTQQVQISSPTDQQITKPLATSQLIVGGPGTGKTHVSFPVLKAAVCIYHKDIFNIYEKKWIDQCLRSILEQTFQDFKVFELNYGNTPGNLWKYNDSSRYEFFTKSFPDHAQAMNFIFDEAFQECNVVFNVNLDDWYAPQRFERQLQAITHGYDLVSSDFCIVDPEGKRMADKIMSRLNISAEFKRGHNLLAHPVIAMTGNFWQRNRWYRPEDYAKRAEDFEMWKRSAAKNEKIFVIPEILLFHRLHKNQTGRLSK